MAAAVPLAPMRPSAWAARPRTRGEASTRRGTNAASADPSPTRPSANAAIARTSGSVSDSLETSSGTPAFDLTRPIASAARRRTRGSPSATSTARSGAEVGGGGVTTGSGFLPFTGGGGGGGAGRSIRSSRWSSSWRIHAIFCGNGTWGASGSLGGGVGTQAVTTTSETAIAVRIAAPVCQAAVVKRATPFFLRWPRRRGQPRCAPRSPARWAPRWCHRAARRSRDR